jgi:hypothetical protein
LFALPPSRLLKDLLMTDDLDTRTKLVIYQSIANSARIPTRAELATQLAAELSSIDSALARLREKKLVFLGRESGEVVMAPPFSAVPTSFLVEAGDRTYFANCVWDAYGIAAALKRDAEILASCGCCGDPMRMAVRNGHPLPTPGIAHFAVPTRHWWDDLTFT